MYTTGLHVLTRRLLRHKPGAALALVSGKIESLKVYLVNIRLVKSEWLISFFQLLNKNTKLWKLSILFMIQITK